MSDKRDCFVIMPFSATASKTEAEWTEIYENVFVPAIKAAGLTCERASPMVGSLSKSIVRRLREAYLVLADITDRNANVFYELGVRHSLSRRTIIVAQEAKHAPSDLLGYWFTIYGTSPGQVSKFKKEMKRLVGEIEKSPEQSDNPVSDYMEAAHVDVSRYQNRENAKRLSALLTELGGNCLELERYIAGLEGQLQGEMSITPWVAERLTHLRISCLDHLLTTYYLDPGPEILKQAFELRERLSYVIRGHVDPSYLAGVLSDISSFISGIERMAEAIQKGEMVDPPSVTNMRWYPSRPTSLVPKWDFGGVAEVDSSIHMKFMASQINGCWTDWAKRARKSVLDSDSGLPISPESSEWTKLFDNSPISCNVCELHELIEPETEVNKSPPDDRAELDEAPH